MIFHKDSIHSSLESTFFILYQDSSMQFHTIPMHTTRRMLQETIHAWNLDWFMVKFFSSFQVHYETNLDVHLRLYRIFPNSMIGHYYRHTSLLCNKPYLNQYKSFKVGFNSGISFLFYNSIIFFSWFNST